MTDISREAVETVAFHLGHSHPDEAPMGQAADMILALRAALDAAEANTRQAVEAEREACAMVAEKMNSHGRFIAAAIRRRGGE